MREEVSEGVKGGHERSEEGRRGIRTDQLCIRG